MITTKHTKRPAFHPLTLALLLMAGPAVAAPVVTEVNSTTLLTYSADVSASDLLHGLTPSTTGWNTSNQASPLELTDGIHGLGFGAVGGDNVQGAWTTVGATAEYDLGLGANGLGYDLTSIVSIADWVNVGFGNQAWTFEVKPVGGSYTTLITVDYQALGTGGGTTKVTVTDDGGVLASGIEFIKITANTQSGHGSGAFVWRELDVIGTDTVGGPDLTAPTVSNLNPADGAAGVAPGSNLVVTFDENVVIGTGNIIIKDLDTPSQTAIPVGDGQVSVSGAVLTINPTTDLDPNTNYAIQIDASAIDDSSGNSFLGISNDTTWNFATATVDLTAPTISTLSPADEASAVSPSADLVVTFDENIAIGSGDITIKDLDTPSQIAIPVGDAQISVSGAVLTISPSANLAPGTNYAIQIDATAIDDLSGNSFVGISNDTTWNFATSVPPAEEFSATELAYTADVSASDLLHGLTAIGSSGFNLTNGSTVAELNDGLHGGTNTPVGGTWTTVGATVEYNLGTSPGGTGWDITSIQSIAAWVNVGFGNQGWTVEVKPVGGSYSALATVDYQPLGSGVGATKVTLTDVSGVLASGVEFIKFTANQVNGGTNAGAFVWREIDVFGVSSGPDETAPTVITLSPADGATDVLPSSNLVVTFDDNIVIGIGNITIKDLDTPSQTVIAVGDGQVSVSGAVLTINPTTDLAASTNYAIQIEAAAIDDDAGNSFAGITDDMTWNFTTGTPDLTAPTIVSTNPADDSSDVPLASNLVVTFDEDIAIGSGNITIKDLDTPSQTVIPVGDAQVSVSGAVLTIDPSSNFATITNYAIQIDATALTDLSGNPFAGIADDTTWNFVSADEPLRIMAMGDSITAGYTDNNTWSVPYWYGYRSGLYNRLDTAGYNFVFVGQSNELPTHFPAGTVPPADLDALGQNAHNGYGGASVGLLNSNILAWLANDEPDIILLKIGTNSQNQSGLDTLVNTITTQRPNLHLIIAEIMPKWTYQQGIVNYNTYIRDTLVPLYQGQGKNVTLVDQYAPFLTNPADLTSIDQSLISNGINHPDNVGYDKMAQEWFEGIEALGLGPNDFGSWISDPAYGLDPADQDFGDDPDGDRLVNGLEAWFGTHPGEFNEGLNGFSTDGTTTNFEHPQNDDPPSDLSGFYEWSLNLEDWYDSGSGPGGGPTVTMVPSTVGTTTTVTATASEALDQLFVRVGVMQN